MWDVDKMKIRWTNQAEEQQAEVFLEKGRATPENFRKLGKKRGGDCRIVVKKKDFPKRNGYRCQRIYQQERGSGKRRGIPDLSRQKARLWFYYRATRYIDCGYEALHMGQVHLYTANDKGMAKTTELFGMIREYAKIHGIRQLGWTGR